MYFVLNPLFSETDKILMKIKQGMTAPQFTAQSWPSGEVSLASLRGKKVWLGFYRYASCPLCKWRIRQIIHEIPSLQAAGIVPIGVFQSSIEDYDRNYQKIQPNFPMICDPEQKLYMLYGIESSWAKTFKPMVVLRAAQAALAGFFPMIPDPPAHRVPADFLLDENGIVQVARYGKDVSDCIPIEEVIAFAESKGVFQKTRAG